MRMGFFHIRNTTFFAALLVSCPSSPSWARNAPLDSCTAAWGTQRNGQCICEADGSVISVDVPVTEEMLGACRRKTLAQTAQLATASLDDAAKTGVTKCDRQTDYRMCPAIIEELQVADHKIGFRGRNITTRCALPIGFSGVFANHSELESYLANQIPSVSGKPAAGMNAACLTEKDPQKLLRIASETYYVMERLSQGSFNALEANAALDLVLGADHILADENCEYGEISGYKEHCQALKACPRRSEIAKNAKEICVSSGAFAKKTCQKPTAQFEELAHATKAAIRARADLESKISKAWLKGACDPVLLALIPGTNVQGKDKCATARQKRDDFHKQIEALEETYPWIKNQKFKELELIVDKSEDLPEEYQAELYRQFKAIRAENHERIGKYLKAGACLFYKKSDCHGFAEIVAQTPDVRDFAYERPQDSKAKAVADAFRQNESCWHARKWDDAAEKLVVNLGVNTALAMLTWGASAAGGLSRAAMLASDAVNAGTASYLVGETCATSLNEFQHRRRTGAAPFSCPTGKDQIIGSGLVSKPGACVVAALMATPALLPFAPAFIKPFVREAEKPWLAKPLSPVKPASGLPKIRAATSLEEVRAYTNEIGTQLDGLIREATGDTAEQVSLLNRIGGIRFNANGATVAQQYETLVGDLSKQIAKTLNTAQDFEVKVAALGAMARLGRQSKGRAYQDAQNQMIAIIQNPSLHSIELRNAAANAALDNQYAFAIVIAKTTTLPSETRVRAILALRQEITRHQPLQLHIADPMLRIAESDAQPIAVRKAARSFLRDYGAAGVDSTGLGQSAANSWLASLPMTGVKDTDSFRKAIAEALQSGRLPQVARYVSVVINGETRFAKIKDILDDAVIIQILGFGKKIEMGRIASREEIESMRISAHAKSAFQGISEATGR